MKTLAISLFCTIFLSVAMMAMKPAYAGCDPGFTAKSCSRVWSVVGDDILACDNAAVRYPDSKAASQCGTLRSYRSRMMNWCEVNIRSCEDKTVKFCSAWGHDGVSGKIDCY